MSTFIFLDVICNSSGSDNFMSKKQANKIFANKIFFDFDSVHNSLDLGPMKVIK